jgi:hypothetical protein
VTATWKTHKKAIQLLGSKKSRRRLEYKNLYHRNPSGTRWKTVLLAEKVKKSATPRDAASYVHEMAIELKGIAESSRLSFLAHLLELAIEESAAKKRGRL